MPSLGPTLCLLLVSFALQVSFALHHPGESLSKADIAMAVVDGMGVAMNNLALKMDQLLENLPGFTPGPVAASSEAGAALESPELAWADSESPELVTDTEAYIDFASNEFQDPGPAASTPASSTPAASLPLHRRPSVAAPLHTPFPGTPFPELSAGLGHP